MQLDFFNKAYSSFSSLMDKYGFKIIELQYYYEVFGNSIIILESNAFRIELTKDKGQIIVWVASLIEPKHSHNLETVLNAIGSFVPHSDTPLESLNIIDETAVLIEKYYDKIALALNKENYPATKAKLEEIYNRSFAQQNTPALNIRQASKSEQKRNQKDGS